MQKLTAILAAAALTGLGSVAIAQTHAPQALTTDHLDAIDPNDDGKVEKAEYEKFMEVTFTTLDVNKDGNLEWSEVTEILPLASFKASDTDGNNALSRSEFMTEVKKDFAAADRDGDGVLN